MKVGLFYGSSTCYTEMCAEKIRDILGADLVQLHNVKDTPLSEMQHYDLLILGISTWDFGELQEDWGVVWSDLASLNLSGKVVALYGLGDQEGYGEWYLDAMGMLYQELAQSGAHFVGQWPTSGYHFDQSKAVVDGQFVGLALDEDSQYDLTDERLATWCEQVMISFADWLEQSA
ncbi:Flavodoxin 2 [Vibrio stylophorae]|uniref:Flavodoxin n=1 Tax=Vibrio stylophorae TaxID=659351 RepID=A0ABM8ZQW4_9VIBR|nr:flavodoxin FldB [Vibrio stylophorae]CAH0532674.1 Flavodoxin 2 [Vibrio stylophorae]